MLVPPVSILSTSRDPPPPPTSHLPAASLRVKMGHSPSLPEAAGRHLGNMLAAGQGVAWGDGRAVPPGEERAPNPWDLP